MATASTFARTESGTLDGSQITFTTNDGGTPGPASNWPDVFVMGADGTNITPVTRTKNWEVEPRWGPAG